MSESFKGLTIFPGLSCTGFKRRGSVVSRAELERVSVVVDRLRYIIISPGGSLSVMHLSDYNRMRTRLCICIRW